MSSNPQLASCISNVVTLKQIISRSFDLLTSKRLTDSVDIPQSECDAVATATLHHFHSQLVSHDKQEGGGEMEEVEDHISINMDPINWNKLNEIISVCFSGSPVTVSGDDGGSDGVKAELAEAIKTQLKEHHLQDLPLFQEKVYYIKSVSLVYIVQYMCTVHYEIVELFVFSGAWKY